MSRDESKNNMRFSLVFSLIFKNRTFFPYKSIWTKNICLITLKAKYQNVPIISEFCHMSRVTGSLLDNLISKNFWDVLHETPCSWDWTSYSSYIYTIIGVAPLNTERTLEKLILKTALWYIIPQPKKQQKRKPMIVNK